MKQLFSLKRILISLIVLLLVIQLIRIDKTNPETIPTEDFIVLTNPPPNIALQIKESCYDCHSNRTRYPWYADVAPVSWIIKSHIDDGRKHLNFSEWGKYDDKNRQRKLAEAAEEITEGNMPMPGYLLLHGKAALTAPTEKELIKWLKSFEVDSIGE